MTGTVPDLASYDTIILAFSGGKDSVASLCCLLDAGVDPARIELWHHDVDGEGRGLMDWPSTLSYVRALAQAYGLPLYRSWRQGGLEGEMLRQDSPTGRVWFETPSGTLTGGGNGPPGTRLRFPQVSPNLTVRWCSSVLKIDVMDVAIRGQERFLGRRTLVVTGERAEESASRARYKVFEPHRTDTRAGSRKRRHVDHWRPVHAFSEQQVWDMLRRYRIVPALPYQLGFSRLSCMTCIFLSASAFATIRFIDPERFAQLAAYERQFRCTIKRSMPLGELADRGEVFAAARARPDLVEAALSKQWLGGIHTAHWTLPAGAFGEASGPS